MAPVDNSPAVHFNFDFICSDKVNDVIPIHKYKSAKTGLTVVLAEVEGPLVNGYFVLATEALDDDGLPHTLEHLIFLGSEDYPYKGVLDLLANRNLASGTNAWTDTDHTCYTMTTAGSEGFLALMPVYLDHILYPTLTESGFITEVHHITGDGEDAGVVYCEMQGREKSGESLTHNQLIKSLYPGECGYKSETGGLMKNLRESTTHEKVKNYHKSFYRPDNLTLVITGQVKPELVFKALEPLELKIQSKGLLEPFDKPWQSPIEPLEQSEDITVPYPSDVEDNGMVHVGWRGPSAVTQLYEFSACSLLLKYLTETSVSPLQKEFVEVDDPYASNVRYSLQENSSSVLYLTFENVPKEKIYQVKNKLLPILSNICESSDGINMKRMKTVIHRQKLETLCNVENHPHDAVAFMIIGDMLYGSSIDDLKQRVNPVKDLDRMYSEPESFWRNLLKAYIVDRPCVTVYGVPSTEEREKVAREEKERIDEQRRELGENGLAEKGCQLNNAICTNEIPPPDEILTCCPVPSTNCINFHKIRSYSSDSKDQYVHFDLKQIPVYTLLDSCTTNFIYLNILMDTSGLSAELRQYLPLFLEAITESSVERDGKLLSHEEVVSELEADTISVMTKIGLSAGCERFHCGSFCQTACLVLKVEPEKYERGVEWLHELLFKTVLTGERLKVIATKMINDVSQAKRVGKSVTKSLVRDLCFNKDNNHYYNSMLRQHKFLTSVVTKLESDATLSSVLNDMETLRTKLATPSNMVVYMAADLDRLTLKYPDIAKPWCGLLTTDSESVQSGLKSTPDWSLLNPPTDSSTNGCVVGMGCIESSFLCQTAPCITDFQHPDLPALFVFFQYLTQLEGPMWKQIRGLGLSYGYAIYPVVNEGLLYLSFYRSTNLVGAYKEAKNIIENQLKNDATWDETLLDSARSSMIFEIIENEKCVSDVVAQSLLSYFKRVGHDHNKILIANIAKVTKDDLLRVGEKYVKSLYDPTKCKISAVCHPSKANEIASAFKQYSYKIDVYQSVDESPLNK